MADQRDRGYAWVALAIAFFLNLVCAASFSTLGIFFVEFLSYFKTSKSTITWIGAIHTFFGNMASILGAPLLKRFGCRPVIAACSLILGISCIINGLFPYLPVLYISFGFFSGIGFMLSYTGSLVSVQMWFDKRRSLASGISSGGLSAGVLIWPPVLRWLIDLYSWQGAFIVLGGVFFNGLVCAALMRNPPVVPVKNSLKIANSLTEEKDVSTSCMKICTTLSKTAPLTLFFLASIFMQMGLMNMYAYTPVRASELNIDSEKIPLLISVMGLVGLISRPLAGCIGDISFVNRTIMFGFCAALAGATAILTTQLRNFALLMTTSTLYGIFSSGYIGLVGAVLVDVVGLANIEIASGLYVASMGIGNVVQHPIAGAVLDRTGNSTTLFWIFGSVQAFGGVLVMLVPFIKQKCVKKIQSQAEVLNMLEINEDVVVI